MAKKQKRKPQYKTQLNRTIAEELFDIWKKLRRPGDTKNIVELTGYSQPTIDLALTYGAVKNQVLSDQITKYFQDRLEKEKEDAARLKNLSNELN